MIDEFEASPADDADITPNAPYNPLANRFIKESNYIRQVARIGFVGGTAGDTPVELFMGTRKIGTFVSSNPGAVTAIIDDDMIPLSGGEFLMPGVELRLHLVGSASNNPLYCRIETKERTDLVVSNGRVMRRRRY